MTNTHLRILLGSDHRGYVLKEQLQEWLAAQGYQVEDRGSHAYVPDDDYPDVAAAVATSLESPDDRGILLCGSSVGVTIAANKVSGARAASGFIPAEVIHGREADDINILCLAADHLDLAKAQELVAAFLDTPYSHADRSNRRLKKIAALEKLDQEAPTNE